MPHSFMSALLRRLVCLPLLSLACLLLGPLAARADERSAGTPESASRTEQLVVNELYLDMRIGPHRWYPVFFVAKQGETITIVLSQAGWLLIRTTNGTEGWVPREALQPMLAAAGIAQPLRDRWLDGPLAGRLSLGVAGSSFDTETMVKMWLGVRITELYSVEASLGRAHGKFASSHLWHIDALAEPFAQRELSPYVGLGLGQLVGLTEDRIDRRPRHTYAQADLRLGMNWRMARHIGLRVDGAMFFPLQSGEGSRQHTALSASLSYSF